MADPREGVGVLVTRDRRTAVRAVQRERDLVRELVPARLEFPQRPDDPVDCVDRIHAAVATADVAEAFLGHD